jgi:hypothetical protein
MLTRVQPVALERGQTADVTISGVQNLSAATGLLFEGSGLEATVSEASPPPQAATTKRRSVAAGSVKARIKVSADARLGPRELRVMTPRGASSVGMVVVVSEPVAVEADDKANDEPARSQAVSLPAAIAGSIGKNEDVDWYSFQAEKGQSITFCLWGNRLEDKIHDLQMHLDPVLSLYDDKGRELAVNDNTLFADPLLIHRFQESGTYLIQVRDTTYAGNPNWTYVLEATAGPFATAVFPMAVNPASRAELHADGVNFDTSQSIPVELPANTPTGAILVPLQTAQGATLPVPLVATALPVSTETEDAPDSFEKAQRLTIPTALCGRLERSNDIDVFTFKAKKGQIFSFEVVSRRAGSNADPVLSIVNERGNALAEADDTFGKDPRLEWSAPADGSFAIWVSDLHSRGGEAFGYVVLAEEAEPDFVLTCDPDKLSAGPGSRTPVFVKVERRAGFKETVRVEVEGLPVGATASPLSIAESMSQGVIAVTVDPSAKPSAALVTLTGKAETSKGTLVRRASPRQEIYLPGGGRGLWTVSTMAMAVTEPSDIVVEASPAKVALKPGGTATIEVSVKRQAGYDKPVNLALNLEHLGQVFATSLPPGVAVRSAGSKTLLASNETKGKIVIEAKPNAAPCQDVPIVVMGHVSINFVVKTAYCSAPVALTVEPK